MMKEDGIGTAEFDVIHFIRHNPGVTQTVMRESLKIDKGAVAKRVASLENKGYLIRKPNPEDGRSQLLYATAKAEDLKNSKAQIETINAANRQAQEILDSATQDANSIRLSAITYTDDMMANIGSVLTQTLEDAGGKYKGFIDALQTCMDVVNHNRQELSPQTAQAAAMSGSYQPADTEASKEDEALLDELGDN